MPDQGDSKQEDYYNGGGGGDGPSHELPDKFSPAGHELPDKQYPYGGQVSHEMQGGYRPSHSHEIGGQEHRFDGRGELVGSWPGPQVGELEGSRLLVEAPA